MTSQELTDYYAEMFDRLNAFLHPHSRGSDIDAVRWATRHGLTTTVQINTLLHTVQEVGEHLSLSLSAGFLNDDEDFGSIDALIVGMLFSTRELEAIRMHRHDPLIWLNAVTRIGSAARAYDDDTQLAFEWYNPREESIIIAALQADMTPLDLIVHAEAQADNGVRNSDLIQTIGPQAVPADLLAADPAAASFVADIRTGTHYNDEESARISHDDAIAVVRALIAQEVPLRQACDDAVLLVSAGAADADEVLRLYTLVRDEVLARPLIQRAAQENLTPAQWLPLIQKIGRRASGYGAKGLLPLALIADASDAGVSVRQWDENVRARGQSAWSTALQEINKAPWDGIYPRDGFPGRVVELTLAGVSPALVDECHRFFGQQTGTAATPVDAVLELHQAGLTLPLVAELGRYVRGFEPIEITVGQTLAALKAGLTVKQVREVRDMVGGRHFGRLVLGTLTKAVEQPEVAPESETATV